VRRRTADDVVGFAAQSLPNSSEKSAAVIEASSAPPSLGLRVAPEGLPDPSIAPPVVAESSDPFAAVRILHLLAQIERGQPVRLSNVVDRLNATYLDWLFTLPVVVDAALQLQSNWTADYRSTAGIVVEDGDRGPTIQIEDTPRVDPWIVRQVRREAATCRERLLAFSRQDREAGDG
jgi:hypothetical protein